MKFSNIPINDVPRADQKSRMTAAMINKPFFVTASRALDREMLMLPLHR
jgi:hypothetical protein